MLHGAEQVVVHRQLCPLPVPPGPKDEPLLPHPGQQPGAEELTQLQRHWVMALLHPASASTLGKAPPHPSTKGPASPLPGCPACCDSVAAARASWPLLFTTCEKPCTTLIKRLPGTGVIHRTAAGPRGMKGDLHVILPVLFIVNGLLSEPLCSGWR